MSEELLLIQKLLAAIVVGYLLGSLPLAHLMASRQGIDIFATGSTRAGTANVFWNISRKRGILVFAGDAAKGFLAVQFASLLGIPDNALIWQVAPPLLATGSPSSPVSEGETEW